MDNQGALVHEMLGKFIDEAVNKAVQERLAALSGETERRIREVMDSGNARLKDTMERASMEIQSRVHQMVEHGLRSLTMEGERIVERTCERLVESTQKATDELPVTIQESLIEMTQENEQIFRRRSEEWMNQVHAETAASLGAVMQAQFEAARKKVLQETAEASKSICDRNLFDFRSEFENNVNRCVTGLAERLTAPWPENPSVQVTKH